MTGCWKNCIFAEDRKQRCFIDEKPFKRSEDKKCVCWTGKKREQYYVGGLDKVNIPGADCLVTISWMHGMSDEYLRDAYHAALEGNKIKYVIVDVKLMESKRKDFGSILPGGYRCIARTKYRAVESEIWIEVWACKTIRSKKYDK